MKTYTPGVQLMLEVGYTNHYGGGPIALSIEFKAAELLAKGEEAHTADLVLVLDGLGREALRTISDYSHAAAESDRAALAVREAFGQRQRLEAELALRRAKRKELDKLERIFDPELRGADALREMLWRVVEARGVKMPVRGGGLSSFRWLGDKIRSARTLRRVIARHRQGIGGMAPGVPDLYERTRLELAQTGIDRF